MLCKVFQCSEVGWKRLSCATWILNGNGCISTCSKGECHCHTVIIICVNRCWCDPFWRGDNAVVLAFFNLCSKLQITPPIICWFISSHETKAGNYLVVRAIIILKIWPARITAINNAVLIDYCSTCYSYYQHATFLQFITENIHWDLGSIRQHYKTKSEGMNKPWWAL